MSENRCGTCGKLASGGFCKPCYDKSFYEPPKIEKHCEFCHFPDLHTKISEDGEEEYEFCLNCGQQQLE